MLPTYLIDIIILLMAAVIFVPLAQYLKLGAILGFLVAGIAVGPWVLGLITTVDEIRHFAELGVVFLLFIIGMELKPRRLLLMRKWVFGLGSAQVLVTGAAFTGIAILLGLDARPALVVGFALALSSTAFVLQLLTDQGLLGTLPGRRSFAVLLLQDLAVVPILALIPLLTQTDISLGMDLVIALGEAVLIFATIIVGGRFFLRPILHQVARTGNTDIFAATGVLLVLGAAGLVTLVGFSMAMGAFVAGLLIADSEYRHQVMADIQPFRGFLLGLFFMSVGMSINFGEALKEPASLIAILLGIMLVKSIFLWLLARAFGIHPNHATATALMLAQAGEFAFVIFGVAFTQGVIDKPLFDQLILIAALSMATTPALSSMARRFFSGADSTTESETPKQESGSDQQVVIAGFGRVGRRVARMLESFDVPYIAIDSNAELVKRYRADGFPVFFGNAGSADVLNSAGIAHSRIVLITMDQQRASEQLVTELRAQLPSLYIIARGRDREHCIRLRQSGADETISENFEASLQLGGEALRRLGYPITQIFEVQQTLRSE